MIAKLLSKTIQTESGEEVESREAKADLSRLYKLWRHMLSETTEQEDLEFIASSYGPCMYSDSRMERIREDYCINYHKKSHLWFADSSVLLTDEKNKQALQIQKNKAHYQAHKMAYERGIHRITEYLRHNLEEQQEPDVIHAQLGVLDAKAVYRVKLMHDLSVFYRELPYPSPDFTVDILLDASASRIRQQENIAAQAYMITRSLDELGIPVQVSCFRSLRGYTVMQRMKGYEDHECDGVFSFFAEGGNRDGLAFGALREMMEDVLKDDRRHLILVLTDALPADSKPAYVPSILKKSLDYDRDLAVEDTRDAVQGLKKEGFAVAAVFLGDTYSIPYCKKIFGGNFARIHNVEQFPDAVIGLLTKILKTFRDS